MKKPSHFQEYEQFFELYDKAIKQKNVKEMKRLITLIRANEILFLKGYQKRKEEGVYYTDEKISIFIIKQLIHTRANSMVGNSQDLNTRTAAYIKLVSTTICDPACGSGVFLLSAAKELFKILYMLDIGLTRVKIKERILGNLYGLDINEYAIKLTTLKLLAWYLQEESADYKRALDILNKNIQVKNSLFDPNWFNILLNGQQFDIIVGNPPYGNIFNKEEKEILKNENIFFADAYCAFILKALEWCKGFIGLLIPKSFLLRQGYIDFRKALLSRVNLLKIFDIGSKMFKGATNEVQIAIFQMKSYNAFKNLVVYDFPDIKIINYENQNFDNLNICFNNSCPLSVRAKKIYAYTFEKACPYCKSETIELNRIRIKPTNDILKALDKIEKSGDLNYLNVKDFPKMIRGEEDKGLKKVKEHLRNDTKGSCYFISARNDFQNYYFKKRKSLNIEDIDAEILKGEDFEYYKGPKLLIKHNNIIPETLFTEETICFTSSIYSLLHEDSNELKYLAAVFNSTLIKFYCTYAINNQKDTTINLNQYMIRHLPIKKPSISMKDEISKKVTTISNDLKKNNGISNETLRGIIQEIDNLIFELYNITEKERELIISSVNN